LAKIKALYNGYYVDISVYLVLISVFFFCFVCEAAVCIFCGLAFYLFDSERQTKRTKWNPNEDHTWNDKC